MYISTIRTSTARQNRLGSRAIAIATSLAVALGLSITASPAAHADVLTGTFATLALLLGPEAHRSMIRVCGSALLVTSFAVLLAAGLASH